MGACGTDREKIIAAPGKEHRLIADMAAQHRSVRNRGDLHAETEIGSFKLHRVGAHFILRSKSRRASQRVHGPHWMQNRTAGCPPGSATVHI